MGSGSLTKATTGEGEQESGGFMSLLGEGVSAIQSMQTALGSMLPAIPGQPAGKYYDIAIGIDFHPTMFPPSPIMAVPHIGMVFDIMGAMFAAINTAIPTPPEPDNAEAEEDPEPSPISVSSVCVSIVKAMAPSVLVNNQFIANAGISIQHLPGIVLHALPSVAPMASSEMFMGSSTVLADGAPFSHQFLPALSCNLVGIPAPFRIKKPKPKISLMAPTSALLTVIPKGLPVLVGGPPTIDLLGMAFGMALKGLGKIAKKAGGILKKSKGWQAIGDSLQNYINKSARKSDLLQSFKCKHFGEPVDAATGRVIAENDDFSLPGPIPLTWTRFYYSDIEEESPIGSNWHHSYHVGYYDMDDRAVSLQFPDGRQTAMPVLQDGDMYYSQPEKITWFKDAKGIAYRGQDGLTYRFSSFTYNDGFHPLESIENELGFDINFSYNQQGVLRQIIDSAGRVIDVLL